MDSFFLLVTSSISSSGTPSILRLPSVGASRNSALMKEDLPAPVGPTIPTYRCDNEGDRLGIGNSNMLQCR